jgi:hypothetical protein
VTGRRALLLLVPCLLASSSCRGDDDTSSTSTTEATGTTSSTVAPDDPTLEPLLLTESELPDGFTATEDVADTVTSFCAGQDAAAGLRAQGRAIVGFSRTPAGASVIEILFRFEADGATTFVDQAADLISSCSDVPDASGLAFAYEPLSDPVTASLDGADRSASAFGTSAGSGAVTVEIAAVASGDLGALIAAVGVDEPRADLDELAATTFEAAIAKLG